MPRLPASVAAADPFRPLTAASPEPGETHSTFPPSATTCNAKSVGTEPLKDTMRRLFATPLRATGANWGVRAGGARPGGARPRLAPPGAPPRAPPAHPDPHPTNENGASRRGGGGGKGPRSPRQQPAL